MSDTEIMTSWLTVLPQRLSAPKSDLELRQIAHRSLKYTLQPIAKLLPKSFYFGPSPLEAEPEDDRLAVWFSYPPAEAPLVWRRHERDLEFAINTIHAVTGLELLVILGNSGKWCVEKPLQQGEKFILWSW